VKVRKAAEGGCVMTPELESCPLDLNLRALTANDRGFEMAAVLEKSAPSQERTYRSDLASLKSSHVNPKT